MKEADGALHKALKEIEDSISIVNRVDPDDVRANDCLHKALSIINCVLDERGFCDESN